VDKSLDSSTIEEREKPKANSGQKQITISDCLAKSNVKPRG